MAYISSATTATLQLTLTDYGRERLIVGSKGIEVTFDRFGISDGDIDYRNTQAHADTTSTANNSAQLGFIPDVTGNRSNFRKAVNNGYKQKNCVYQTPQNTNLNRRQSSQKFVTVGIQFAPCNQASVISKNLILGVSARGIPPRLLPDTSKSPLIFVLPDTSKGSDGVDVPIPTFPAV